MKSHLPRIIVAAAVLAIAAGGASPAFGDPVDDLVAAIAGFRGVGAPDVTAYRVELRLPDDGDDIATLVETWEAPARLAIRGASPGTPVAVVRGLALFLEPLFVTRTSLFSVDLEGSIGRVREEVGVAEQAEPNGTRTITVTFPDSVSSDLPEMLQDLVQLEGVLDARGRLVAMSVLLRSQTELQRMTMRCEWADGEPQPRRAVWTLPNSDQVEIQTTYRAEADRMLPAIRRVTFPSRYDPGETEEIRVTYGRYELNPEIAEDSWRAHGTFRYDANGLVDD